MPRSHGFFVPRSTGPGLVAAGFVSVKFPDRVPADQFVVRTFLGGALHPEVAELSEPDLAELATRSLAPLLGLREPPTWTRVHRHLGSMPQFAVGHLDRVARLRARLAGEPELAGLEFAGGPQGAYGLPDSIAAAAGAAARVVDRIPSAART
jgi:oxygen-dependent protoporphyrinogen oxidase